jgi:hypothetical protein
MYALSIGSTSSSIGGAARVERVHWSRVIHVADNLLDDDVFGEPALLAVANYLHDLVKVVGGGAEAAWRRADPGMVLKAEPDLQLDEEETAALESDVEDFIHRLSHVVRTRGVDVELLQSQVSQFGANAESIIQLIAATKEIPVRILTGSERGELASTQDRSNWNDRVAAERETFAEPLIRDLVNRLVDVGALPEPAVPYEIVWPEEEELDESEKAKLADELAGANEKQMRAEGSLITTADEIRDAVLGLGPLSDVLDPVGVGDGSERPPAPPEPSTASRSLTVLRAAKRRKAERRAAATTPGGILARTHRIAARHEPRLAAAFRKAFEAGRDAVDLDELEAAIASGDQRRVEHALEVATIDFGAAVDAALPAEVVAATAERGGA